MKSRFRLSVITIFWSVANFELPGCKKMTVYPAVASPNYYCTLRENFYQVSAYLKVVLVIYFTVLLVSWWGRTVKRRKRSNEHEISLVIWSMERCSWVMSLSRTKWNHLKSSNKCHKNKHLNAQQKLKIRFIFRSISKNHAVQYIVQEGQTQSCVNHDITC